MVSYRQTDMKIPVRPAPAPPASRPSRTSLRSNAFFDSWNDGNESFKNGNVSQTFSTQRSGPVVKKKPPPRPPPPKMNNTVRSLNDLRQGKGNVLTGLFSRSSNHFYSSNAAFHKQSSTKDHNVVVASLIDFDSPAGSPTFTTRSSSDGVSVNSFGSDGSTSNNGNTPSGGTASLFENGFEDDFDFFGGLTMNNNTKTPVVNQKDPWSISPQDPIFSGRIKQEETVLGSENNLCVNDSSGNLSNQNYQPNNVGVIKPPMLTSVMPTIIRAKPNKPSVPAKLSQASSQQPKMGNTQSSNPFNNNLDLFGSSKSFSYTSSDNSQEWSPPMPSVPPPPPPENVNPDDIPILLPDLPPRKSLVKNKRIPHGIALYDYSSSHPDDLNFKCNDIIHILRKINDEWYCGEKANQRGMFPANFINVMVPVDESNTDTTAMKTVTALYRFAAQQWDDLDFPEGAVIKVLSQINNDWLYGEYRGKRGQFPSTFVDHVPAGLPTRKCE